MKLALGLTAAVLGLSLLTIGVLAAMTFSGVQPARVESLVGLGFAAMWSAAGSAILLIVLAVLRSVRLARDARARESAEALPRTDLTEPA
ncbi:hypothetical protein [Humidisolicoccus flavus]|uniref:hypothetical protein n=1 Tax=Humidisolicoccus flavus TaxID=3111414 RepID=UPI00324F2CAA